MSSTLELHPTYEPSTGPQRPRGRGAPLAVAGALAALLLAAPAVAQIVVAPGVDLFRTPGLGSTSQDFSGMPIPANFFDPGSQPFTGTVQLRGTPLNALSPLGPTDTVVRRNAGTSLLCDGPGNTVPIEIVALSLVSVNPITVTYSVGAPESWNVRVALSSLGPQVPGQMTIRQSGQQGGTFSATLPVTPRLIFDRALPPKQVVLDGLPPIQFTSNGYWSQSSPPELGICQSPGGIQVDHDQNPGTPPVLVGPTSNFVAGVIGLPSACEGPPAGAGKTLTVEEALLAKHGVLPPQCVIPPREGAAFIGDKCFITTPAMALSMGAVYLGDNTVCLGDLNHNGRDDALPPGVPGATPLGMAVLLGLLIGLAAWFLRGRRTTEAGA